jgi:protoporphyrinogen oxidase
MGAMRTAILGAGMLGLTLAYRLTCRGQHVTVIERESQAGGLAAGFQVASEPDGSPIYLDKFYHHLFRADHAVIQLIDELGLSGRLVWPSPTSCILRNGKIHRMDGPLPLLRLEVLPPIDRLRLGAVLAYLKLEKVYQRFEQATARQWLTTWAGQNVYSVFAEPLLRQKFGEFSDDIAMPWFWSRVHLRSTSLGYLLGGFQSLYDVLAGAVESGGGHVRLGSPVTAIEPLRDGSLSVKTREGTERYDRVVSTLPARLTIALTAKMPRDFAARYGGGDALGAHCLVLEIDRQLTKHYWIAVNDPGYPFLAVVEHTNYISPDQYQGKHLVYVGNYLPMTHSLYAKSGPQILGEFLPYLQRLNPDLSASWIKKVHSFSAPFAQPVVTTRFKASMAPHVTPVPNLYLANMFQIYPQDRGQNYSVTMADRMVRLLDRAEAGG